MDFRRPERFFLFQVRLVPGAFAVFPDPAQRRPVGEILGTPDLDAFVTGEEAETAAGFWAEVSIWQVLGVVITVAAAAGVILAANETNKRVETDVLRSYARLGSWARWLGLLFQPAHTPYERADIMVTAVPEGSRPIRNLTQHFVLKQFSGNGDSQYDTLQEWRELRPLLIRKALAARWQRLRQREPRRQRRSR